METTHIERAQTSTNTCENALNGASMWPRAASSKQLGELRHSDTQHYERREPVDNGRSATGSNVLKRAKARQLVGHSFDRNTSTTASYTSGVESEFATTHLK